MIAASRVVYVVGLGATTGVRAGEVVAILRSIEEQLGGVAVNRFATLDRRVDEPGLREGIERYCGGPWTLGGYAAEELARVTVPTPSEWMSWLLGTPSVAEAAALLGASKFGDAALALTKQRGNGVTVAVATASWAAPGAGT